MEERYVDILRPHINAFVAYFSEIIKEYDPENFIGLSGGDTYRRWSDIVKKQLMLIQNYTYQKNKQNLWTI